MINNSIISSTEKAVVSFDKIKESLKGLMDILRIISPNENDIYYELGKDNIIFLYHKIVDLILNEDGVRQLRRKIKDSEVKLGIPSTDFLRSRK